MFDVFTSSKKRFQKPWRFVVVLAFGLGALAIILVTLAGNQNVSTSNRLQARSVHARDIVLQGSAEGAVDPVASIVQQQHLDPSTVREVVSPSAADGQIGVYVGARADGQEHCIFELSPSHTGGGCDVDIFHGSSLAWTLYFDDGPQPADMTALHIVGLSQSAVARLDLITSNGQKEAVALNSEGGFSYSEPASELAAGVLPAALVAYDHSGREIDSFDVSINR